MTLGQLEKLVKKWQRRLEPLGVGHWTIRSIEIVQADTMHAEARCSMFYDYVFFKFAEDWLDEADLDEVETTIIHEWLHVAWRDFESVEGDVRSQLAPPVAELARQRFDHEREGLIQRIAETIFMVHSSRV